MFKNLKAKTEEMNDLITRAEDIVNKAVAEKRELTDEEKAEIAKVKGEVKEIRSFIDTCNEISGAALPIDKDAQERAIEERAIEEAETRAFANYIRGVITNERDGELAPANNGKIVPKTIAKKIVAKVYDLCPILERSDKYNTKGKLELPLYPKDGESDITVAYASEFTDLTSTTGDFDTIELDGFLAGALTKISKSLINNTDIDLVGFVVKRMAYNIARFIEKELLGMGDTTKVTGLSDVTNVITKAAIDGDTLIDVQGAVKDIYQKDAIWIMSSKTRDAIRKFKDDVGRYLLIDDLTSPFGKVLLGKPVYVTDNMPEIASGKTVIYYGDMTALATNFHEEMSIEVLRELFAAQHALGCVGWVEFDGKVQDQQKVAALAIS
jgi:HK97 family phage major capsid protein